MQDFRECTLPVIVVVVLMVALVVMGVIMTAPELPKEYEVQQALDLHAFNRGLCPAYSEITLHLDGTWTCSPK